MINFAPVAASFICEQHFDPEDVKVHGTSKRLKDNAVPIYFPRLKSVSRDHDYVKAAPLNFVSCWVVHRPQPIHMS